MFKESNNHIKVYPTSRQAKKGLRITVLYVPLPEWKIPFYRDIQELTFSLQFSAI